METKRLLLWFASGNKGDNITNSSTARVIIVDPTQIFCAGMRNCLAAGKHIVLGEARNLEEALQQLETLTPDLIVIGPSFVEHESLELCREILSRWPKIKTIIYTSHANDLLFLVDAVYIGVAACLLPESTDEECLAMIAKVMAGQQFYSRDTLALAFQLIELTVKEREVLKLMAQGKTNREIAAALAVQLATIRSHTQHILQKLNVHSRQQAVWRARHRGLI